MGLAKMKSLRVPNVVLNIIFAGILVASIGAVVLDLALLDYLEGILRGQLVDDVWAAAADARQAMLGVIQFGLYVACVLAFFVWIFRAQQNLRLAGLDGLRFTPEWAILWFFVPIFNLVQPYRTMKQLWAGSKLLAGQAEADSWEKVAPSGEVVLWWTAFVLMGIVSQASGTRMSRAETLEEILIASRWALAADVLVILAAMAGMLLVRRISALQDAARSRGDGAVGAGGPWP